MRGRRERAAGTALILAGAAGPALILAGAAACGARSSTEHDAGVHDASVADTNVADAAAPDATPLPSGPAIVIFNPDVPGSFTVAQRYVGFRELPKSRLCAIGAPDPTTLPGSDYPAFLDAVLACVDANGGRDAIEYVVPVYGVPYKVEGRIGDLATGAPVTTSLDALLVFGEDSLAIDAPTPNPLHRPGSSITGVYEDWIPFREARAGYGRDYFMVARIDGADADAARALIDRAEAAQAAAAKGLLDGIVYVDGNRGLPHPASEGGFGSYEWGEWNIIGVENVFASLGWYPVVADYDPAEFGTAPAPLACPDALYYAGWYSFGNYNDVFTWRTGAIGGHLDSCSACDIRGDRDWSARALRRGITATFGAVNEPYVAGMPEYDQFFKYLTEGATYGEAAYQSTYYGSWMMVWVGDPLYRPH